MTTPPAVPDFGPRALRPYRALQGFLPAYTWGLRLVVGRTPRLVLVVLLAALVGFIVGSQGLGRGRFPDVVFDLWRALDVSLLQFAVPLVALVLVAGGFQREVSERTLVYHLVRPISRRTLFLARYLAGCTVAVPVAMVPAFLTLAFSGVELPTADWVRVALPIGLGVVATGAIYYLLAAAFRFGTIAGLVYTFVIDAFIQSASGTMQKLSATYYVRSLHHQLLDPAFVERSSRVAAEVERTARPPMEGLENATLLPGAEPIAWLATRDAVLVLAVLTAGLLVLGLWIVSRRDYALKE